MARPLRIEYPGAWYHVMNRGRRRETIFHTPKEYEAFLDLVGKCFELFELEVHAYSLLPNHYHLLVRTPRGNLSRAMRHLDGVYTQKFNRRYGAEGTVFRGRYKAILVDRDSYAMELVRYIHRNPMTAGLEKKVGGHQWTSHRYYHQKEGRPGWLKREFVLRYFGKREKEALGRMDAFVKEEPSEEIMKRMGGVNWPAVLGGEKFKEWVKEKYLGRRLDEKGVPQLRELLRHQKIGHLKELARERWGCGPDLWQKVRRGRENPKRRAMIYASRRFLKATGWEISEAFGGIGHGAISMQCRSAEQEIREKKGCCADVQDLERALNLQLKT